MTVPAATQPPRPPGPPGPRPPRSPRGRRTARTSGDEREVAILATAERLLADRPLSDISIDDLARGAGISRPTFYFYFASKDAVVLALLDRVIDQVNRTASDVLEDIAGDPAAGWRASIRVFYETFREHRPVVLAASRIHGTDNEVRQLWAGVMETWTRRTAAAIDAERARGAAPGGPPARDLAIVLNSMNERVLYGTFTLDGPAVGEADVVETLAAVWLRAIYQDTPPGG